jgi:hypothetical protein
MFNVNSQKITRNNFSALLVGHCLTLSQSELQTLSLWRLTAICFEELMRDLSGGTSFEKLGGAGGAGVSIA